MPTPKPRRHPLQTFQFWFVMLMVPAALAVWRMNLINARRKGGKLPVVTSEPLPPPPLMVEDEPLRTRQEAAAQDLHFALAAPNRDAPSLPLPGGRFMDLGIRSATFEQAEAPEQTKYIQTVSADMPQLPPRQPLFASLPETALPPRHPLDSPLPEPVPESVAQPQPTIDMAQLRALLASGDEVAAHRLLSTWYWQQPSQRELFRTEINALAKKIYFQSDVHYSPAYVIQSGDTLESLAVKERVPAEYLAKLNRLTSTSLKAGETLKMISGPFNAVVDLSDFELTVHAHGFYVTSVPLGIGLDQSTPAGWFRVAEKTTNPEYIGPAGKIARGDPRNPLGGYWLALSGADGAATPYGIHGAADERLIGQSTGPGCLRVSDADASLLFDLLISGSEILVQE